jgi:hypothetical protein
VDEKKAELLRYLAEQAVAISYEEKVVESTYVKDILCNNIREDNTGLMPCTHEEADTRLLLHVVDCVKQGHHRVSVRTVDSDVLVLAIAMFHQLDARELWIAFGVGKHFRYIPIHCTAQSLGPAQSCTVSLPVFHAFTGCDLTSSFGGKGKKTAWETWNVFAETTAAFRALSDTPTEEQVDNVMLLLERFVVLMYDRSSTCLKLDEVRKELFTQKGRTMMLYHPLLPL